MRISTKPEDPGYGLNPENYQVLFDGEILHDCHTADEELGLAIIYERVSDGKFKWDPVNGIAEKELRGRVEVVVNLEGRPHEVKS